MNDREETLLEATSYWLEGLEVPVDIFMQLTELGYDADALQNKFLK